MLTLLALLGPWTLGGEGSRAPDELYRRVVAHALERAQTELLAGEFVADHSRWEDPWVVATDHYEVRTTRSYAFAAEIARSLEFVQGEVGRLLGAEAPAESRMRVWIFPTLDAYNQFGQQNGAEHSSLLGSFYSTQHAEQPVVTYWIPNKTLLGMWITHSAVHQYLEHVFGDRAPVWVSEGLAGYFALYWDWAYGARELERIQQAKLLVPLARLFDEPLQAYLERPNERFIELGMLFQFLLRSWEATRGDPAHPEVVGSFQEFLRVAVRGQDTAGTEFARTLAEARDQIEADFRAFPFPR